MLAGSFNVCRAGPEPSRSRHGRRHGGPTPRVSTGRWFLPAHDADAARRDATDFAAVDHGIDARHAVGPRSGRDGPQFPAAVDVTALLRDPRYSAAFDRKDGKGSARKDSWRGPPMKAASQGAIACPVVAKASRIPWMTLRRGRHFGPIGHVLYQAYLRPWAADLCRPRLVQSPHVRCDGTVQK